jgi:hypothetical protein
MLVYDTMLVHLHEKLVKTLAYNPKPVASLIYRSVCILTYTLSIITHLTWTYYQFLKIASTMTSKTVEI